ncbi:class I SAM-dependent DNA methyltransferase [Desulfovibrio piger]|uniref:class I SAM-dependent DNA methyltransferase n=1 Tax=Desulfovibrio piger TaxID=901 RepID=UPI0026E99F31|nr:class I SAM-dependent DNA methyltransferase [Desulfovibrio piger]
MAVKKSEIYSSLWASCDTLRGGMDASLYKDYVLFMLFIKYVSDKFADAGPFAAFNVPAGASFADMCLLKGRPDIGDKINKQIIQPIIDVNSATLARTDFPDFNDATKLGSGKEMVDRLTSLIAIFEDEKLDFSKNRTDNDDLLGDAYEYLMRHFATESGKSKGQFYTPSEVSRVIARVIGIRPETVTKSTSAYDPTCGSGSLLLKVAAEAGQNITLEGQEKDVMTVGLARMNMLLHGVSDAVIAAGNTLANPRFTDNGQLRTYDYVVANPPFSDKKWSLGFLPEIDQYQRFTWGVPPAKQGDYAYLLHIIRSMKPDGQGACILPHGVLFRGNAEEGIRRQLVDSGCLKGIIGLPANLFYGTGIPACILVLDKENAVSRKGVFMIDASKGFAKDGNKNRLRERDIHRIVTVFTAMQDVPGYARMVSREEIASEKNNYNLNLPRYIDGSDTEDIHSLDAHLNGGIPDRDIDAMAETWKALPHLRDKLFSPIPGTEKSTLAVPREELKDAVQQHDEYKELEREANATMKSWQQKNIPLMQQFDAGESPKKLIFTLSETMLEAFRPVPLADAYALYQSLMEYWADIMQDDFYQIAADGWKAEPTWTTKGRKKVWHCDLLPKEYIVNRYFSKEEAELLELETALESASQEKEALEEDNSGEDGAFSDLDSIKKASIKALLKEIKNDADRADDAAVLKEWLLLDETMSKLKTKIKKVEEELDKKTVAQYAKLDEDTLKDILVHDKWMPVLEAALAEELARAVRQVEERILELDARYAHTLPELVHNVDELSARVAEHLKRMGLAWN